MASKTSKTHKSVKHEIIDKANRNTVASVAGATFIVIFCIFATKTLFSQSLYHNRLIGEKEKALVQLKENREMLRTLEQSYNSFVNEPENILGGNPTGEDALDGNNATLILDSLPSKYDYPALSSSFEKILKDGGYTINAIGGLEDIGFATLDTGDAVPVEVPYTFTVTASTDRTEDLLQTLERSIRPMYVDSIQVQVNDNDLQTRITLHTFFTQEKTFQLGSKVVK